ncbi:crotonobetainyl-CoA--carnitine CoA-transferase [Amycolatopsis sp. NPDC005003]
MAWEERVRAPDFARVAERYRALHPAAGGAPAVPAEAFGDITVRFDEAYCREVADVFEHAPHHVDDPALAGSYDRLIRESRQQYLALRDAGLEVRPWIGGGQPYRDSAELIAGVRGTGVLHVFLTRDGHGPGPQRAGHPMLGRSGIVAHGVDFTHNDVFRVVHDVFGHVLPGHGFGPRGEFKAAYCHMQVFSAEAHPALFTEQIGQVAWYFYGPHRRGDPPRRTWPYAEQKVFPYDARYLTEFRRMFAVRPSSQERA